MPDEKKGKCFLRLGLDLGLGLRRSDRTQLVWCFVDEPGPIPVPGTDAFPGWSHAVPQVLQFSSEDDIGAPSHS